MDWWIQSQNKHKNITITKNKSLLLFSEQCIIAKHVISHPVIAVIVDVILKN